MVNYILADYKRVISRIPRILFLVIYEVIFASVVLGKWSKAAGNYNSVALLADSDLFISIWFSITVCLVDFVHSFSYDFSAKTIQVALGIGITRLQVILSKLIQTTLVILTDLLVTFGVFGILCSITGCSLAGHQILYVLYNGLGNVLLGGLSVCLVMPLVFRTQNMVMSMIGCFALLVDIPHMILRWASRLGPVFLTRLELERYTHGNCSSVIVTNATTGNFQLWPYIAAIAWFAIGIYLTWILFRKMELDF